MTITDRALSRNFGLGWALLSVAFLTNILEDAFTDFVPMYNATVLTLYGHVDWFPRLDITPRGWLIGAVLLLVLLFALLPFAFGNAKWLRPFAYLIAVLSILLAAGYTALTLRGGTTPSVKFPGVAPGFRTAWLLVVAGIYLLISLWRSTPANALQKAPGRAI